MKKIIKATGTDVVIFDDQTEEYLKLIPADFNFVPQVGDVVEVHKLENEYIINKVELKEKSDDRININIVNENNSTNSSQNVNTAIASASTTNLDYPPGKRVNKLVYVLLAFFFGAFGAHQFYAGKTSKGFLYLALSLIGVSIILGWIDGFVAIFKTADANGNILV
ncbi:TM2 domain-containing protein [Streptococcus suis]|uniref:TM2 domain-containing protein n=1 Tax=Streptococcus suis TaxID=1307 RepID=UPI000CF45BD6|nr:TM2 domain-containing protein [Streptococcus suis]